MPTLARTLYVSLPLCLYVRANMADRRTPGLGTTHVPDHVGYAQPRPAQRIKTAVRNASRLARTTATVKNVRKGPVRNSPEPLEKPSIIGQHAAGQTDLVDERILVVMSWEQHRLRSAHGQLRVLHVFYNVVPDHDLIQRVQFSLILGGHVQEHELGVPGKEPSHVC